MQIRPGAVLRALGGGGGRPAGGGWRRRAGWRWRCRGHFVEMTGRTLSAEEEVAAVRKQLDTLDTELQHADERLARALSTSSNSSRPTGDLPPLAGRPPPSPPLPEASRLPLPHALESSAGSASSADTSASGSAGDSPGAATRPRGAAADDAPRRAQPSSCGWIFRCVITTKAGRCVVNCAPHASAGGVRGGEGGGLAVGPLCRLLVTMHQFSQGGFLSYVQIHNRGVVLVDGGSYLVGIICAAGVDLPAVKLRAVQIRHVFGLLHQSQVDEMQARHEAEAEAMLKTYTIHSSRTEHGESAEPQTAPPFAHFEQLCAPAFSPRAADLSQCAGGHSQLISANAASCCQLLARHATGAIGFGGVAAATVAAAGSAALLPDRRDQWQYAALFFEHR